MYKKFTNTKKFYVQDIAAVNLSKIYFMKNSKKTCKPNNRDLNHDWINDRSSENVILSTKISLIASYLFRTAFPQFTLAFILNPCLEWNSQFIIRPSKFRSWGVFCSIYSDSWQHVCSSLLCSALHVVSFCFAQCLQNKENHTDFSLVIIMKAHFVA